MSQKSRRIAYMVLAVVLFLGLTLPRAGGLMGQDEVSHYYKLVRLLFTKGWSEPGELIAFSPHGYPLIVLAVCKIAGAVTPTTERVAGILMWLVLLALMFYEERERKTGIPAALLLAVTATACQAAVTIEIDQTALPLFCLLEVMAFMRLRKAPSVRGWLLAAFSLAVALWMRVTTPLLLCLPLAFASSLGGNRRDLAVTLGAMAAGVAIFLGTWGLYCSATGVGFEIPFVYMARSFMETTVGVRASGLGRIAQNVVYLCLWGFNPFLAALFAWDGWRRARAAWRVRRLGDGDEYWLCAAVILVGYTFVGGALFGFPKYQCPALPLVCLAVCQSAGRESEPLGLLAAVGVFMASCMLGDPLLSIRCGMRNPDALSSPTIQLLMLGGRVLVCYMVAGAFIFWPRRRLSLSLLLTGALAMNAGTTLFQSCVPYSTGYIYGEQGECARLAALIREHGWEHETLIVPVEVVNLLGFYDTATMRPNEWKGCDYCAQLVETTKPRVVAFSFLINPVSFTREIRTSKCLNQVLNKYYDKTCDNSLTVWTLKSP